MGTSLYNLVKEKGCLVWVVSIIILISVSASAQQWILKDIKADPCETEAVNFIEWVHLNDYARDTKGNWYISDCTAAGHDEPLYTTKQLYKLFKLKQ